MRWRRWVCVALLLACRRESPTVEGVLERYRTALGGDALGRVAAVEMWGTVEGLGFSGTTYSVQDSAGRIMERIQLGPLSYAWGWTGQDGWIQDQSGAVRTLSDAEREELLLLASVGGLRSVDPMLRERLTVDPSQSDSAYVCLRMEHEGRPIRLFFGRKSGLLERMTLTKLGMPLEAEFTDFKTVGGVTFPSRSVQRIGKAFSLQVVIHDVRLNPPVGAQAFERPRTGAQMPDTCTIPVSVNGHLVTSVEVNGIPSRFFIDTGAGISCLDRTHASRLGLATQGALPAQGVVGFDSAGITTVDLLRVGCVSMEKVQMAVVDLSSLATGDSPVDGILGYGLFSQRSVARLSPKALRLSPPGEVPQGFVRLGLSFVANVPVVEASVGGKRGKFLVDTGNSFELIVHTPFATRHGLMPRERSAGTTAAGIGGGQEVFLAPVDSVELGGVVLREVTALFAPQGRGAVQAAEVAGNIGLPLLERFWWVLDYPSSSLYLRPRGSEPGGTE